MKTYGIERERFIANAAGLIVPAIGTLLPAVHETAHKNGISPSLFTHELFAGQIEDRTPPCASVDAIKHALCENDRILVNSASALGFTFDYSEMLDANRITSLDVNPFDVRHKDIWVKLPKERKIAASVVAAVHVHVSCGEEEAVRVLNACRNSVIEELIDLGDHSHGQRIQAYRAMAETDGTPPEFGSFTGVMAYIEFRGGEKNVWDLVRYKPSTKTVEFRMFGTTSDTNEIATYVEACIEVVKRSS